MQNLMFQELKVVELASVLAGPLVGSFFAELGAEVLKVENKKTNGDVTRNWKLPQEEASKTISAYYAAANFGKKNVFLDLSHSQDYDELIDIVKTADILLVNYKPGDAQKLKLDYESIRAINDSIIYTELTGFGDADDRPAFDVVLQAETGYMSINGEKGAKPLKMPIAMIDILAAHQLKEGILCALIHRMKTGKGSKVSVSLYDAAVSSLANQATNYLMAGVIPVPMGSEHPNIAPYGDMFQTRDGDWIVLAVGTERHFVDLCEAIEALDIMAMKCFSRNLERVKNRAELNKMLSTQILKWSTGEIEYKLSDRKIPYGRVKNLKQVLDAPEAKKLVLSDNIEGIEAKRVRTAIFSMR